MSLKITEACIQCGACEWECPAEAIFPGPDRPSIVAASCTECWGFYSDSQCAVVCPASAIVVSSEDVRVLERRYGHVAPSRPATDTWAWRRFSKKPPAPAPA